MTVPLAARSIGRHACVATRPLNNIDAKNFIEAARKLVRTDFAKSLIKIKNADTVYKNVEVVRDITAGDDGFFDIRAHTGVALNDCYVRQCIRQFRALFGSAVKCDYLRAFTDEGFGDCPTNSGTSTQYERRKPG